MDKYQAKLLIIGDSGVGKTSLSYRLVNNTFLQEDSMTIGVDYAQKELSLIDPETRMKYTISVQIWDTAGQERFDAIVTSFYRNVHGILCVFDLSEPNTFRHIISRWIPNIQKYCPDIPILMIGNKQELAHLSLETDKLAREYCETQGYPLVSCSCQTGDGVKEAFNQLVHQIVLKYQLTNLRKTPLNLHHHLKFTENSDPEIDLTINHPKKYYCC